MTLGKKCHLETLDMTFPEDDQRVIEFSGKGRNAYLLTLISDFTLSEQT